MGSKKMKLTSNISPRLPELRERKLFHSITVKNFFETHDKFMADKSLEGLRESIFNYSKKI